MAFRLHRDALVHRVDNLEDDVRRRDAEIGRLRRAVAATPAERWRRIALVLGALALALTLVAMRLVLRPIAEAAARPVEVAHWQPDQDGPFFADVDGDGDEEVIGSYADADGARWLGAVGSDGALRWKSALSGERHHFTVTRDRVVVGDERELVVLRLADGQPVARSPLPEPAREICVHRDRRGPVWIRGTREHRLLHPDGRLEPSLRPGFCDPHEVTTAPRIRGMQTDVALLDGHHVVTLARDGKRAVLAGFVVGDEAVRWQTSLPGAPLVPGRDALLHAERVVVARGDTIAAYAADDGRELWQSRLPSGAPVTRLVGGARRIAVVHGSALTLLDDTGRAIATLGR
jgi:hypothetical protein